MLFKVLSVILGILMVITGITCVCVPEIPYSTIPLLMGMAVLAAGIGFIIVWYLHKKAGDSQLLLLVCGILNVVLGCVILFNDSVQWGLALSYPAYVAAWLLVTGIFRIVDSIAMKGLGKRVREVIGADNGSVMLRAAMRELGRKWWVHFISGILLVLLGILCMYNPITTALAIGVMMGIGIIVSGLDLILAALAAI